MPLRANDSQNMTEVPKIVHRRLRDSALRQAGQPHPDADLIAAFAEQALSPDERGAVLEHLALCIDCRHVVALALPADELVATSAASFETAPVIDRVTDQANVSRSGSSPSASRTSGNSFAWANLLWTNMRWAALAAGVAVAILGVRVGLEHRSQTNTPVATAVPAPTFAKPIAPQQEQPAPEATTQFSARTTPEAKSPEATSEPTSKVQPSHPSVKQSQRQSQHSSPIAQPPTAPIPGTPDAGVLASNRPTESDQTVEISGIPRLGSEASPNDLLAMNESPSIERAKPAPDESKFVNSPVHSASEAIPQVSPSTASALKQDTAWSISAGVLQRSLDGGRNWQPVLEGTHAWLCYAVRGRDVWVGGKGGALQHSTDGGTTWTPVAIVNDGHSLAADVARIDVRGSGEVVLSTASHETWVTRDSGKTWDKQ